MPETGGHGPERGEPGVSTVDYGALMSTEAQQSDMDNKLEELAAAPTKATHAATPEWAIPARESLAPGEITTSFSPERPKTTRRAKVGAFVRDKLGSDAQSTVTELDSECALKEQRTQRSQATVIPSTRPHPGSQGVEPGVVQGGLAPRLAEDDFERSRQEHQAQQDKEAERILNATTITTEQVVAESAPPAPEPEPPVEAPAVEVPAPTVPADTTTQETVEPPKPMAPEVPPSPTQEPALEEFEQMRQAVADGFNGVELENRLRQLREERAARFATPEITAATAEEQAGLETPATYGARMNADGLWELSPRDVALGDGEFRVDAARQMIEGFNAAILTERSIDGNLATAKTTEQEQLFDEAIKAQLEGSEKLMRADALDAEVRAQDGPLTKLRSEIAKRTATAEDDTKSPSVQKGARTALGKLAPQLTELESKLNAKQIESSELRTSAKELLDSYKNIDKATKEFIDERGDAYDTFISQKRSELLEQAESRRAVTRDSVKTTTNDEILRTEGEDPDDENQGTRIKDAEVAQAVANAEKFTYEQLRSFEAQRAEALRTNPNAESSRLAEQRNTQIKGLQTKIDGIHEAAKTQAYTERNVADVKYQENYAQYSEYVTNLMAKEGSGKLLVPISGNVEQAERLMGDVMRNLGVDPASEANTEVILRNSFLKPKYIDRYVLKGSEVRDASTRGVAMVARYDYETGKLVRFDIVKEPLKFDASDREIKAWRRKIEASLKSGRDTRPDFTAQPIPTADNVKMKSKDRYAQMMRGYGMPADRAQSSAGSGKVRSNFWARFWGW